MTNISPSDAAAALGRIKTERKAVASRRNGQAGGRQPLPSEEIPCTCGTTTDQHKATCRRWKTLYQRERRKKLKNNPEISL